MKYFYEENSSWKSTENWFTFRCKCSIFGTTTWCIDDCKENEKHTTPDKCPQRSIRYGIKDFYKFLHTSKGKKIALFGSLITLAITITININITNNWDYEDIDGVGNGKKAKFKIAIVTQEYRWKFESSDSIETGLVKKELPELLDNLKGFDNMIGLIAIGTASQEGNAIQEVSRADRRADNIVAVFRQVDLASNKDIYKLNLGQYLTKEQSTSIAETSVQRRLIIIGIQHKEKEMTIEEIREALKDALQKSSLKYTLKTKSYSDFDFKDMK